MSPYQLFLIYGLEYITCIFNTYSVSVFSAETQIVDPKTFSLIFGKKNVTKPFQ